MSNHFQSIYDEVGMKPKSLFITFYKFSVTVCMAHKNGILVNLGVLLDQAQSQETRQQVLSLTKSLQEQLEQALNVHIDLNRYSTLERKLNAITRAASDAGASVRVLQDAEGNVRSYNLNYQKQGTQVSKSFTQDDSGFVLRNSSVSATMNTDLKNLQASYQALEAAQKKLFSLNPATQAEQFRIVEQEVLRLRNGVEDYKRVLQDAGKVTLTPNATGTGTTAPTNIGNSPVPVAHSSEPIAKTVRLYENQLVLLEQINAAKTQDAVHQENFNNLLTTQNKLYSAQYELEKAKRTGSTQEEIALREQQVGVLQQRTNGYRALANQMGLTTEQQNQLSDALANHQIKMAGVNKENKKSASIFGNLLTSMKQTLKVVLMSGLAWQVFSRGLAVVQGAIDNVKELDKSMTELKKVTDETDATYSRFLKRAGTEAQELGATLTDVVDATATFARLGYSMPEAEELSKTAILYKNVADGIDNIEESNEVLISTMKAFNISAEDAIGIADRFNEVGNKYAVSSSDIGEAMKRSASSMATAGNTIDQTIGLIVAMNEVIQDADTAGTSLKTISMRLRNTAGALAEMGEDSEGAAESITNLQSNILQWTNNKVNIMDNNNTFKSTYDIIYELSKVWNDLTDVQQASLTKMIAGVRQGNSFNAMLINMASGAKAYETSMDSAGSATKENEKYLNSIEGKTAQFQASWQALSTTLIDSGLVKVFVDLGTSLVKFLGILDGAPAKIMLFTLAARTVFGLLDVKKLTSIWKIFQGIKTIFKGGSLFSGMSFAFPGLEVLTNLPKSLNTMGKAFTYARVNGKSFSTGLKAVAPAANSMNSALTTTKTVALTTEAAISGLTLVIGVLAAALTIGITLFNNAQAATEEANEAAKEAYSKNKQVVATLKEQIASYKELNEQKSKVLPGSDEQQKLVQEIQSLQFEIKQNLGEQGKQIDLNNGAYKEQLTLLEQIRAEKEYGKEQQDNAHADTAQKKSDLWTEIEDRTGWFDTINATNTLFDSTFDNQFSADGSHWSQAVDATGNGRIKVAKAKIAGKNMASVNGVEDDPVEVAKLQIKELQQERDTIAGMSENSFNGGGKTKGNILSDFTTEISQLQGAIDAYTASLDEETKTKATAALMGDQFNGVNVETQSGYDSLIKSIEESDESLVVENLTHEATIQLLKTIAQEKFPEYAVAAQEAASVSGYSFEQVEEILKNTQEAIDTLNSGMEEYNTNGYISVETFQNLMSLDSQYLNLLSAKEGRLILNKEATEKLTKAMIEQQAIASATAFLDSVEQTSAENRAEKIKELTATIEMNTNATWKSVYARLAAMGLTESENKAALAQIQKYQALSDAAVAGVGKSIASTSSSVTDVWKEAYEKEYDTLQHLKNMDAISTADYYKKLKALNDKYFRGKSKYLEEDRKNLEELHNLQKEILEEQKDKYEDAIDYIQKFINKKIEALEQEKDALEKKNEEQKKENDLEKAKQNLAKAQQKSMRVYYEDKGWVWEADPEAVKEAQQEVDDAITDQKIQAIDDKIEWYEALGDSWKNLGDTYETENQRMNAEALLGKDIEAEILDERSERLEKFKTDYINILKQITEASKTSNAEISKLGSGGGSGYSSKASSGKTSPSASSSKEEKDIVVTSQNISTSKTVNDNQKYGAGYKAGLASGDGSAVKKPVVPALPAPPTIGNLIPKHASGTLSSSGGLAVTQEEGNELLIEPPSQGQYTVLRDGSGVLPSPLTKNIFTAAQNPATWAARGLEQLFQNVSTGGNRSPEQITEVTNIDIRELKMPDFSGSVDDFVRELRQYSKNYSPVN